jgi:hypothetical protein
MRAVVNLALEVSMIMSLFKSKLVVSLLFAVVLLLSACSAEVEDEGRAGEARSADFEEETMLYFPWPPPRASAQVRIPSDFFLGTDGNSSFGFVANRLEQALKQAGYRELQYYALPGDSLPSGFALVTPLEQINADASPKLLPGRWAPTPAIPRLTSLWDYLRTAIQGNPGQYRVMVFLTTSDAVRQDTAVRVTRGAAESWRYGGWSSLPYSLGDLPYTDKHSTTVLIYEFAQTSLDSEPAIRPSSIPGNAHLYRSRIWPALGD